MAWGKDKGQEVKCSEIPSPDVYLEIIARQKVGYLMEEYPSQEWLAYLIGRETENKNFFVEDIVVPPHAEASGAHAEAEPFTVPSGCIGIIHSHHSMGAFHSHTDQTYADRNHPVSITVSKRQGGLEFDAVSAQKTPCGKVAMTQCSVKYVAPPPLFDKEEWLKEAKTNVEKGKKAVVVSGLAPAMVEYLQRIGREDQIEHLTQGDVDRDKKKKKFNWKKAKKEKKVPLITQEDIEEASAIYANAFGQVLPRSEIEDMLANGDPRGLDYWQ